MIYLDNFFKKGFSCCYISCFEKNFTIDNFVKIIYCNHGIVKTYIDGKNTTLNENEFCIIFPYQIHSFTGLTNNDEIIEICFEPDFISKYTKYFTSYVISSPKIELNGQNKVKSEYIFGAIKHELNNDSDTDIMIGYCISLVSVIIKNANLISRGVSIKNNDGCIADDKHLLSQILFYCEKHYNESIHITDAANELYVTRAKISSVMKKFLNISFSSYINRLRISRACKLIDSGVESITEIAFSSGFNTIRTFNRTFNRIVGYSPSVYKKNNKNK